MWNIPFQSLVPALSLMASLGTKVVLRKLERDRRIARSFSACSTRSSDDSMQALAPVGSRSKKTDVVTRIHELMQSDTAGDPMTGLKWTRRTTAPRSAQLERLLGHRQPRRLRPRPRHPLQQLKACHHPRLKRRPAARQAHPQKVGALVHRQRQ